jgi:hypothetical protein
MLVSDSCKNGVSPHNHFFYNIGVRCYGFSFLNIILRFKFKTTPYKLRCFDREEDHIGYFDTQRTN